MPGWVAATRHSKVHVVVVVVIVVVVVVIVVVVVVATVVVVVVIGSPKGRRMIHGEDA